MFIFNFDLNNFTDFCEYLLIVNLTSATRFKRVVTGATNTCLEQSTGKQVHQVRLSWLKGSIVHARGLGKVQHFVQHDCIKDVSTSLRNTQQHWVSKHSLSANDRILVSFMFHTESLMYRVNITKHKIKKKLKYKDDITTRNRENLWGVIKRWMRHQTHSATTEGCCHSNLGLHNTWGLPQADHLHATLHATAGPTQYPLHEWTYFSEGQLFWIINLWLVGPK